jgi:hypothetical protein
MTGNTDRTSPRHEMSVLPIALTFACDALLLREESRGVVPLSLVLSGILFLTFRFRFMHSN